MTAKLLSLTGIIVVATIIYMLAFAGRHKPPTKNATLTNKKQARFPLEMYRIMERSQSLTLLSISEGNNTGKGKFHGYQIIKRKLVRDRKLKAQLIAVLKRGLTENSAKSKCFDPGLGVRAVQAKSKVDMLICFRCSGIIIYVNDKEASDSISQSPKQLFDRVLKDKLK